MADQIVLPAQPREDVGKGASRRLRRAARVPAIIYGGDAQPRMISLPEKELKKALESEAFFSQVSALDFGDDRVDVIVKDLQRHPARTDVIHADFQRIVAGQSVQVMVQIHFLGEEECVGVREGGGLINHHINEVEISALPRNLPEYLELDVSALAIGDSLHLSDIRLPEGVEIPTLALGEDHDQPVVGVEAPRLAQEAEVEEADAEAAAGGETPEELEPQPDQPPSEEPPADESDESEG